MQALFDLIKTLSPKEKAYLKEHVFKRESNQRKLFETINQLLKKKEEINDEAIKKKHKKATFIKQLSVAKNKLYHQLLKGLRLYHTNQKERSSRIILSELIDFVHILQEKGIYSAMDKELKRVKMMAYEYEAFQELLQLLWLERQFIIEQKGKKLMEQIEALNQEERVILNQLNQEKAYQQLQFQLEALLKTKHFEDKTTKEEGLKNIAAHPLLEMETKANTFRSKLCFHNIKALIAFRAKDKRPIYQHYSAILSLWQNKPKSIAENPTAYRRALCNYLHGCYYTERYEEYPEIIAQIKALPAASIITEGKIFQMVAYHETLWYLDGGHLDKAKLEALNELGKQLIQLKDYINPARFLALCSNMMLIYFYLEDFDNAYDWSNEIFDYPKLDVRKSVRKLNLLFQLILQLELGNQRVIPNLVRNAKRQLEKMGELEVVEQIMLKHMRKTGDLNDFDKEGIQEQLQAFQTELNAIRESDISSRSLQVYNNYSLWLRYRIEGGRLSDFLST